VFISGPIIGSLLYALGGFSIPFLAVGSTAMCSALVTWLMLTKDVTSNSKKQENTSKTCSKEEPHENEEKEPLSQARVKKENLSITAVFSNIGVLLPFIDAFVCFLGDGVSQAMLEPHLSKNANATQTQVALTFSIMGGVFTVSTPLVGYVSETVTCNSETKLCVFRWLTNGKLMLC